MLKLPQKISSVLSIPVTIEVVRRAAPVDAYQRLEWHLSSLLLAVDNMYGRIASIEQLHLVMWALRFPEDRETFLSWWRGESIDTPIQTARFDPFLERVLALAIGDGLLARKGERWTLSPKGVGLLQKIESSESLLRNEKAFLKDAGKISLSAVRKKLMDA